MTSTHPIITIDLVLDRSNTKDVLRAVLHAVLFHRLFGTVKPRTFDVLDVTLPGVDDADTDRLVGEKVGAFWRAVEERLGDKKGQITVTFSEKKPKKSWFQVYMGEEEVPWEQWIINAEVRQPKFERDRTQMTAELSHTLSAALLTMATHTSSERGRTAVPLITSSSSISPFPMAIAVRVGGVEVG